MKISEGRRTIIIDPDLWSLLHYVAESAEGFADHTEAGKSYVMNNSLVAFPPAIFREMASHIRQALKIYDDFNGPAIR